MDIMSPAERSARMSLIRSTNTKPELRVRQLLYQLGYRYRLHRQDIPGRPDIVFPGRRKVVFVHGCFWHNHEGCKVGHLPHSRQDYWSAKFSRNKERDAANLEAATSQGWRALVVWECEVGNLDTLAVQLIAFLGSTNCGVEK
ncbi:MULTISPECIES: very short patch repair endonuclease [unclassified Mesorhizobium]|uniref:very short patch repair endonuclease n=1 Tax=unclassified Mesorhizobium TaxID=325217 RepID=UPI00333DE0C9